jgi:hypothetical protein
MKTVTEEARERFGPFHSVVAEMAAVEIVAANRYLDAGDPKEALVEYRKARHLWERYQDDMAPDERGRIVGALRELQARLIVIPGLTDPDDREPFAKGGAIRRRAQTEIRRRGGAMRYRTLKLPDGRYMHVAVTREPGPRGGRTVATGEPKEPKEG